MIAENGVRAVLFARHIEDAQPTRTTSYRTRDTLLADLLGLPGKG